MKDDVHYHCPRCGKQYVDDGLRHYRDGEKVCFECATTKETLSKSVIKRLAVQRSSVKDDKIEVEPIKEYKMNVGMCIAAEVRILEEDFNTALELLRRVNEVSTPHQEFADDIKDFLDSIEKEK